jgi:flagellar basal body-associated protein FliL
MEWNNTDLAKLITRKSKENKDILIDLLTLFNKLLYDITPEEKELIRIEIREKLNGYLNQ